VKLAFVNRVHPKTPHISGIRVWRFGQELARRGHKVVQLTSPFPPHDSGVSLAAARNAFVDHDWQEPLLIPVPPTSAPLLDAARRDRLPTHMRRAFTLYASIFRGGFHYDWTLGAVPFLGMLKKEFQPDLTWATFGDLSNLTLAKRVSRACSSALVFDFKDSLSVYGPNLPRSVKKLLAYPLRNPDAITANADALADETRWYLGQPCATVYSGVDSAFYEKVTGEGAGPRNLTLTLTGSVRSASRVRDLLHCLKQWNESQVRERQVQLLYFGSDGSLLEPHVRDLEAARWVRISSYVSIDQLAATCRTAMANIYIRADITFKGGPLHHKLLELLAAGRPVIAVGGETEESFRLRDAAGGVLLAPRNLPELRDAIASVIGNAIPLPESSSKSCRFGWETQAEKLEQVFLSCLERRRTCVD
jgi:glycosyltransferase involved in cell wall biosynthesis